MMIDRHSALGRAWHFARRVWRFLFGLWTRTDRAELGLIAAGVAFFGFLAIFPALAAVIALWGFWADPHVLREQIEPLRQFLPESAFKVLSGQVETLISSNSSNLGLSTFLSLLFALWSARAGVAALIRGLNAIHHLPNRESMWHQLRAIVLTLVLVALTLMAMLAAVAGPLAIRWLPIGPWTALLLEGINLLLAFLFVTLAIGLIYRLGPNAEKAPRLLTRGLFIALLLWALVSRGFVLYLANFNTYNEVYGSIGAIVALLMWFYLSAYAVLLGAAYDAEHKTRSRVGRGLGR
ncbi:MAG: YihY/virulence factor BrkB family protein [Paracoccaceae bacterium]